MPRTVALFRGLYLAAAWLFLAGVAAQVFLVGLVLVAGRSSFDLHRALGHALALPLLLMLLALLFGRFPAPLRRGTWILFAVYLLQADVLLFLREPLPLLAALHPVLALVDVLLGVELARRATALLRAPQPRAAPLGAPP